MAGLDTPPATYAPAGDPILASLHQRLLSDSDPLRLASAPASATTDFTPGAPGKDTAVPLTDASLTPSTPPQTAQTEVASAAPAASTAVPADLVPPTTPPPGTQGDAATAASASSPAAAVKLADSSPASATATSFSYGDAGSSCDDQSICNWKPNPNSTSQLTKDWFAAHQGQASATVDNVYKVKFGDDLEGIAKRELKAEGKEGSSVKDEVAKIIRLNHDHYKSLDCNKDFIRTGWTLKLNDNSVAAAPPQQTDAAPPAPAPVTTPDTTCKVDAPCGADVIVDNPNGQTFYNGKKVGDHDRSIVTHGQAVEVPIPGNGPPPPQRIGDAATPAAATPVADAPSTPAPAAAAKPIETAAAASPDTPPPVVAPKAIDSALVVAAPDTPPPVVSSKPIVAAAPDTPPPVVPASQTPDTSAAALTPGPDEVQAPVAPANAPPPRRVAATPPPAAPSAAPDAPPNSQTASGSPAVPLDGDALGPS